MKKAISALLAAALLCGLVSCAGKQEPSGSQGAGPSASQGADSSAPGTGQPEPASPPEDQGVSYTLYIGMSGAFQEYAAVYDGALNEVGLVPPEAILAAMSELTGWNLDLAGQVTQGKGGMTVAFADTCAIFTGPPEVQKDEFHMYDAYQLTATILDSIQQTFRQYYVNVQAGGDPESLDIYYCGPDGQSIDVPGLDLTIPMDQPYQGLES